MILKPQLSKSIVIAVSVFTLVVVICGFGGASGRTTQQQASQRESWMAFEEALPVLTSPRCLNCHAPGNQPTQGDAMIHHNMGIERGADGHGSPSLHCSACHQAQNIASLHSPPGADDWHMPSSNMPMIWQGLTPAQLCQSLTDPQRNGHRNTSQVIDHLSTGLVRWGWNPGVGRIIPPLSYDDFVGKMKEWKDNGSACSLP